MLCAGFLPIQGVGKTGHPQFHSLQIKDGLPQISVLDIAQDATGYMWFATRDGLARWDGYGFDVYKVEEADSCSLSDNYVTSLVADADSSLWVGTLHGISHYHPRSRRFTNYYADRDGLSDNKVRRLFRDAAGRIWGCTNDGICRYDPQKDRFEAFLTGTKEHNNRFDCLVETATGDSLLLGHGGGLSSYNPRTGRVTEIFGDQENYRVRTLYKDRRGNIWVGTTNAGIILLDPRLQVRNHFVHDESGNSLNNNFVRCIREDRSGRILIGTFDGLNIYDPTSGSFQSYRIGDDRNESGLSFFSIHAICCDRSNTVWLGSYVGGVNYFTDDYEPFLQFEEPKSEDHRLIGIIGPMVADGEGIWISKEGSGLLYFDPENHTYRQYSLTAASQDFRSNIINSLFKRGDRLWVGFNNGRVVEFDPKHERVTRSYKLPNASSAVTLYVDIDRYIYIGTFDEQGHGLIVIDPQGNITNDFTDSEGHKVEFRNICSIVGEEDGSILLGSNVEGIYRYNIHTHRYEFRNLQLPEFHKQEAAVNHLYRDKEGHIWVATMRHGLLCLDQSLEIVSRYSRADGLTSNTVCSVTSDEAGQIWLSTLSSITAIQPQSRNVRSWTSPEVNEYSFRSVVTAEGEILFGADRGMVRLHPDEDRLRAFETRPPILKEVRWDNEVLTETHELFRDGVLCFPQGRTSLSFEFRSLDYIETDLIRYAWKLDGFSSEWSEPSTATSVNFNNLPAGEYCFHIKAFKNADDPEGCEGESISFRVLPPLWQRWWAIVGYLLLFAGAIALWQRWIYTKLRLENDVRLKQQEQERSEKIHNERINMFTNFSHELRTPLTMIITPLEEIFREGSAPESMREKLKLMYANANRLLLLVNQLLDFRKSESGRLKIRAAAGEFVRFAAEIIMAFRELARSRGIEIIYEPQRPEMILWYDRALMEKVLFNLLSNAVKNTPDGGRITVRINLLDDHKAELQVEDTGIGIAPEKLGRIFDPFYQTQVDNTTGTGIGLSLTKSIVDLHHGQISVTSQPGAGTLFRVQLPIEESVFSPDELIEDYHSSENILRYVAGAGTVESGIPESTEHREPEQTESADDAPEQTPSTGKSYTILVADDNRDLRRYMRQSLEGEYRVLEATDGEDAILQAFAHMPDLVVSDVMMPRRDGIQVCHTLKNDLRTSHIPVILLTARSTILQVEEGLKIGADDYITKPFNMQLLKLRIANLLRMRERLKETFSKQFNLSNVREEPVTSPDERFLQKLYAIMKEHLNDPNLNTDLFCREIGMSRSNFYYKIKTLTDLSPTEFIRNNRLQIAAQLLAEKRIPIAEVSVMVGFNNHSYFSNCFKKLFGCSPTEYYERNK